MWSKAAMASSPSFSAHGLLARHGRTIRQLVTFGFVGVAATVTHAGLAYGLMVMSDINAYLANLVGYICAVAVSFAGHARLTFDYRDSWWRAFGRFMVVSSSSLVVSTIILAIVRHHSLEPWVYALATLTIVPPLTFVLSKFWVFARRG